jgi:hypothetical protein
VRTRALEEILMEFRIPFGRKIFHLVYIHSRIESVTEEPKPYPTVINVENGVMSAIRFRKTRVELMPKPYKTSCFDYKNIILNSRSDCIFKCKVDNYVRNLSGWPAKYYTDDRESELLMAESGYESMDSVPVSLKNFILSLVLGCFIRTLIGQKQIRSLKLELRTYL